MPPTAVTIIVMSQYKRTSTQPGPKTISDAELVPSEYRRDAEKLKEMFPSWTAAGVCVRLGRCSTCVWLTVPTDLASVLSEVGGDIGTAVTRITEGARQLVTAICAHLNVVQQRMLENWVLQDARRTKLHMVRTFI